MTENKRFTLRLHPKDKGVKIFNNHDEDNWRVLNLHFNDYEDAKFVRGKLEPVVDLLNEQHEEIQFLKTKIAQLIEQNTKNNDLLLLDIRILQKALWCSGCENDYGRLRELRKEFLE